MRIFLDANILFSAAKSNGAMRRFLRMLARAGHECSVDAYVREEARRNIAAKSPQDSAYLDTLLAGMTQTDAHVDELTAEVALRLPEKDRPVLVAAIRQRCDVLLTGDRTHFGLLHGKTIQGVTIHSPSSLAIALFG